MINNLYFMPWKTRKFLLPSSLPLIPSDAFTHAGFLLENILPQVILETVLHSFATKYPLVYLARQQIRKSLGEFGLVKNS